MAHLLRNTPFGCGMSKAECNADLELTKKAKKLEQIAKKAAKARHKASKK